MAPVTENSEDPRVPAVRGENTAGGDGLVGTTSRSVFLWSFRAVVSVAMLLAVCGAKGLNFGDEEVLAAISQPPRSTRALLFYNAASGESATARLDGAGNYTFVRSISGPMEWTHITGTASGGVLFYNDPTGDGATARLDNAGTYQFVGPISGFARGWTHIVSANQGSLLFYNAASGEGATARLDGAGNYTFVRSISGFATGWTHIAGL